MHKTLLITQDPALTQAVTAAAPSKEQLQVAGSPMEIHQALRRPQFAIYLVDQHLTDPGALGVLKRVQAQPDFADCKVAILNAPSDENLLQLAREYGAQEFFSSPLDQDSLAHFLRQAAAQRRMKKGADALRAPGELSRRIRMQEQAMQFGQHLARIPPEVQGSLRSSLQVLLSQVQETSPNFMLALQQISSAYFAQLAELLELADRHRGEVDPALAARVIALKQQNLFSMLDDYALLRLAELIEEQVLQPGDELMTQNIPAQGVYFVREGVVSILVNEEVIAHRSVGDTLGEMSIFLGEPNATATVRAVTPAKVWRIERASFAWLINHLPEIWRKLVSQLSGRIQEISARKSELLQHSSEGLVKLDPQGNITEEFSRLIIQLFGSDDLIGVPFGELLFSRKDDREAWVGTYPLLFEPMLGFSPLCDLLPQEVVVMDSQGKKRHLRLVYHPCRNKKGELTAVDVGLLDVSTAKAQEAMNQLLKEEENRRARIFSDPTGFMDLVALGQGLLDRLDAGVPRSADLLRDLHSFKGLSGSYGFGALKQLSHELESTLAEGAAHLATHLAEWRKAFLEARANLDQLNPELKKRLTGFPLSQEEVSRLEAHLRAGETAPALEIIRGLKQMDLGRVFDSWPQQAQALAEKLGKEVDVTLSLEDVKVSLTAFQSLSGVLPHLLRNMLDHGIEDPQTRLEKGKPTCGAIKINLLSGLNHISLRLQDDGKGVDPEVIFHKAANNNHLDQTLVAELVRLRDWQSILLLPGFSSAESLSETSGRGVGMDAVHHALRQFGGNLDIESEPGRGILFSLTLPQGI